MILKRQTLQHKYTHEAYYYKASFILVLTYAIIGHKAQGTTIKSKKLIHISNSLALGLTYVNYVIKSYKLFKFINFWSLQTYIIKCIYQH